MNFRIHVFKLAGESVLYVEADDIETAQREALTKASELKFSPGRSPYMVVAFEGLEEVSSKQEEIEI